MFRRALLLSSLFALSAVPSLATDTKPVIKPSHHSLVQNPSGYRFMVGDVEVTALSDGSIPVDYHQVLTNVEPQKIDSLLDESVQKSPVETSINAFLVRMGNRVVLVDTGAGEVFGPKIGGYLLAALAANGVQPDKVTDICITHVHSDHSGGLSRGGQRLFSNAKVHVGKPDIDFFLDEANSTKSGYPKHFFEEAIKTVKPYADAGQVDAFSGETEILPGLKGTVIGGHTPGSSLYTLESNGERIVFVGDIVHFAAVQLPRPETTVAFDVTPEAAAKNRAEYFKKWTNDRTLIAVPHLNFPGVGHLRADGAGYRWLPIQQTNRAFE